MGSLGASGDPRSFEKRNRDRIQDPTPAEREMTVNGLREGEQYWKPTGDTVVAQSFSAIAKIRDTHREYLDAINHNDDLTDEARARAVAAFGQTETAKFLDTIEEAVDTRLTVAQAKYDAQLASLSKEGDAAQESRNLRIRDRIIDTLKASDSPVSAAQQIAEKASAEELSVFLQEVPHPLKPRSANKLDQPRCGAEVAGSGGSPARGDARQPGENRCSARHHGSPQRVSNRLSADAACRPEPVRPRCSLTQLNKDHPHRALLASMVWDVARQPAFLTR